MTNVHITPETGVPILRIRELSVCFSGRRWVWANHNVSFDVWPGEIVALVGESGSGKTTVLNSIVGLLHGEPGAVSGSIELNGRAILPDPARYVRNANADQRSGIIKNTIGWDVAHRRMVKPVLGREIGIVFQEPVYSLDPRMTIARQFEELLWRHAPTVARNGSGKHVADMLSTVELDFDEIAQKTPSQLSGGECQRVSLAMALILRPPLLLCDEPTTSVDVEVRAQLHGLLERYAKAERCGVLLVSHHWPEVRHLATRVLVMHGGQVVESIGRTRLASAAVGGLHPVTAMWRDGDATLMAQHPVNDSDHRREIGCPLASSCAPAAARGSEFAKRCAMGPVPEIHVNEDQDTRCWLFEGGSQTGTRP